MLLDNDTFLTNLNKLFTQSKNGGSLYITMKRYDGRTKPLPRKGRATEVPASQENSCLFRVTLGSQKISTVVHSKDMNRFNQAYSILLKASMDGLKKRDKRSRAAVPKSYRTEKS
ncbi:Signal recognition particle 14kDa (ous Alu RNA binding protein) [Fasciolopsis buskii]|uniref:Signal recognition particle 14 kDa protein n=1 Tax=Fasciolopsis buskii TaxID=27845 RepID=A0A8E0S211_9TREM|nr:Signal recognition particle 14kDa (ous Alu RNA binding protein) [Fasciolopsis buski]